MSLIAVISLSAIAALLVVFGVIYAIYIYFKPFRHGWTWISVLIGDAITDVGAGLSLLVIIISAGHGDLWYIALIPFLAHILTGAPMIIGQVKKRQDQIRKNGKIIRKLKSRNGVDAHGKTP